MWECDCDCFFHISVNCRICRSLCLRLTFHHIFSDKQNSINSNLWKLCVAAGAKHQFSFVIRYKLKIIYLVN